jgi:hypothetical protein
LDGFCACTWAFVFFGAPSAPRTTRHEPTHPPPTPTACELRELHATHHPCARASHMHMHDPRRAADRSRSPPRITQEPGGPAGHFQTVEGHLCTPCSFRV